MSVSFRLLAPALAVFAHISIKEENERGGGEKRPSLYSQIGDRKKKGEDGRTRTEEDIYQARYVRACVKEKESCPS